jgi:hypothetical protein
MSDDVRNLVSSFENMQIRSAAQARQKIGKSAQKQHRTTSRSFQVLSRSHLGLDTGPQPAKLRGQMRVVKIEYLDPLEHPYAIHAPRRATPPPIPTPAASAPVPQTEQPPTKMSEADKWIWAFIFGAIGVGALTLLA